MSETVGAKQVAGELIDKHDLGPAVVAEAITATAIGDRLRMFKKLFDMIGAIGIDLKELGPIGEALYAIVKAPTAKDKILAAAKALEVIAAATSNAVDDQIAKMLRSLVNDHLDWFLSLLPGAKVDGEYPTQSVVESRGVNFGLWTQIVMFILEILKQFRQQPAVA